MRSNGLLKWLMIPVALLVLFVAIRLFSGGSTSTQPAADAGAQLTPEEMKALGIEGDTPRYRGDPGGAGEAIAHRASDHALDNKSQREENQRLRQRENAIDQRINSALETERPTCAATSSRQPASASRPRDCSPTCSGAWKASAGAAAATPIYPWAWGCVTATRQAWKAACAGSSRTTRSPLMGVTAVVARVAA